MPSGGDIINITCNHPDLGILEFNPKSGVDSTYMRGGILTDDTDTDIDSTGSPIYKMNQKRASFQVDISWSMDSRYELENLQLLSQSTREGAWTFSNVNGVVYKLTGKPVGDVSGNGNTSTITLKVSGNPKTFQII